MSINFTQQQVLEIIKTMKKLNKKIVIEINKPQFDAETIERNFRTPSRDFKRHVKRHLARKKNSR